MKIVIKTKKVSSKQKILNKIYLEIINYLVNYEHYSLDTITNINKLLYTTNILEIARKREKNNKIYN
ncbi:hypothetical protein [Spiroplasma endosymbiont of Polydrusus formosus]|uniref:hypothetical protein n=1 Tax=Spiroplasma endosymbiont of Polydrusus formosus TaxID=3139326 RepID=UPI0035B56C55